MRDLIAALIGWDAFSCIDLASCDAIGRTSASRGRLAIMMRLDSHVYKLIGYCDVFCYI